MRTIFVFLLLSLAGCGFDQGIQREYIISDTNQEDVTESVLDEEL